MRRKRHFIHFSGDFRKRDLRGGARRGQSILETAILILVFVFAMIAMQVYLKRGIQGGLRGAIDGIGEQYAPEDVISEYNMVHESDVTTTTQSWEEAYVDPASWGGQYQNRVITMVRAQTHYDNTFRNGYEYVGPTPL